MLAEAQRQGRVVPEERRVDVLREQQAVEQLALRLDRLPWRQPLREARHGDRDSAVRPLDLHPRAGDGTEHGLLDEIDAPMARVTRHEVLRALIDEVPPQMRQAHEVATRFGLG